MRIFAVFIVTLSIIIVASRSWCLLNRQKLTSSTVTITPDNTSLVTQHSYSLDSLISHTGLTGNLKIEKKVSETSAFTSYIVSYISEKLTLYALMNQPQVSPPLGGWPVVVLAHGHIPPKLYSTVNSYQNTAAFFASHGFLVLKPDYRGHDQSPGSIDQVVSRAQYAVDVLNLINAVSSLKDANPDRIYLYGHSMGGDISLVVIENTTRVKAASLWAPAVSTYPQNITYFFDKSRPSTPSAQQFHQQLNRLIDTYGTDSFSSFTHTSKITVPVIIQQGTADESVPYSWGQQLAVKLKNEGKNVTFYSYKNDNHDISKNWSAALTRDINFFNSVR